MTMSDIVLGAALVFFVVAAWGVIAIVTGRHRDL